MGKGTIGLWRTVLFGQRCPYCAAMIGSFACEGCAAALPAATRVAGAPIPKEGHALEHVKHAYAPFWYKGPVRYGIWRMKYHGAWALAGFYAQKMMQCLCAAHGCAASKYPALPYDCVVPVPTTWWEHRKRDNIPFALARALGKRLHRPVKLRALKKTRETKRQMTLSGKQRLENVKDAYAVRKPRAMQGLRVLLVDDVLTTGSTGNECAAALRAAGAQACDVVCVAASEKF